MGEAADEQIVVQLTASELAGLERTIPPGPPGGELAAGDAVVSAFDIDLRAIGPDYELVCEPAGFRALVAHVDDVGVRVQGGLDEDLDEAITKVLEAAEEAGHA